MKRGGNYRCWSEANAAYDPEAAHIVLSAGICPIVMYPWDAYLDVEFSRAEIDALHHSSPLHSGSVTQDVSRPQSPTSQLPAGWTQKFSYTQNRKYFFHAESKSSVWSVADIGKLDPSPQCHPTSPTQSMKNSAQELCVRLFRREMTKWNKESAGIGDGAVAAFIVDPGCMQAEMRNVRVELHGNITRGMTAVDLRSAVDPPDLQKEPENVSVIVHQDIARVKRAFAEYVFGEDKAAKALCSRALE